ncbi:hypothetical protein BpHYR1_006920 [Brachionus plicatilis]|uniref:Uncharacterized protein n=1 Tax=Brachionus plicatilis TaxID=10195 RepID=A0A3M7QSW7_BRAPC|nr:hypothetical protein BpHYR1_006920 [Brachionus plicatilis]
MLLEINIFKKNIFQHLFSRVDQRLKSRFFYRVINRSQMVEYFTLIGNIKPALQIISTDTNFMSPKLGVYKITPILTLNYTIIKNSNSLLHHNNLDLKSGLVPKN